MAQLHGAPESAARAMNMIAAIRFTQNHHQEARELYEQARLLAVDAGADELIGRPTQNAGIIENICGDLREARRLYLESIGSTVRSGDRRTTMMTYNNLGMVCADLRE